MNTEQLFSTRNKDPYPGLSVFTKYRYRTARVLVHVLWLGYGSAFLWPELTYNRGHVSFRPHHPLRQYRHGGVEQWDLSGKTNWKFRESRSPPVLYHLPRQMRRNGYLEIMQINFLNLQHTKVKYDEGMDWSFDRGMVMCWISVHLNIYKLNSLLVWKWNQWIRNQISCAY